MTEDKAYKAWWHNEGSGIIPLFNEDMEEFAHRITQIAWSNGAFKEREACAKKIVEESSLPYTYSKAGGRGVCLIGRKEVAKRNPS